MKVSIGSDHAGFAMKSELSLWLRERGYEVVDLGANNTEPSDYPDFARAVGGTIARGETERGLLVCGSGVGACVAANKVKGVRAGICHDTFSARQGVEDDDMNVLCLGARIIGIELAKELIRSFLEAKFSRLERHERRLSKVLEIEAAQK